MSKGYTTVTEDRETLYLEAIEAAIATLRNDLYAKRAQNALGILESALAEAQEISDDAD